MSVTVVDVPDPQDLSGYNVLQVDCDAPTNDDAVLEIDDWADNHGFIRTNEYWLRQVIKNGRRFFRGICYRITHDEWTAIDDDAKRVAEIVKSIQARSEANDDEAGSD